MDANDVWPTGQVPASLDWLRGHAEGRRWLAALPGRVAECAAQWSLRLGAPYEGAYVSLVLPARLPDGTEAVLKVQFPEPDSRYEAAALRLWGGAGAVRLLAHDEQRLALLMERCTPGAALAEAGADRALAVLGDLIPRLWRPATPPFDRADVVSARWARELPARWEAAGRPCEQRLVEVAAATLRELAASQQQLVLLNHDLHVNNVLRSDRTPWLVIDPKPLLGERELAVAAIARDYGLGHSRAEVHHRWQALSEGLGVDRERARGWSLAYAVVWAFLDEAGQSRHFETARWLLDA